MTDEKKPDQLEIEKIKLERFRVRGKIITVTISVLFGSVLGVVMNWFYQNKQLELEAMKHLGEFVEYALDKDSKRRLRFAEYFATLSPSEKFRNNWTKYYGLIENKEKEFAVKEKELEAAQQVVKFLEENKKDDFAEQLRVAKFFADFPVDEILQKQWIKYRDELNKLKTVLDEKKEMLAAATEAGNDEEVRLLETGIALIKDQWKILPEEQMIAAQKDVDGLEAELSELTEEPTYYLTVKEAKRLYLDNNWKPRTYTDNKFEETIIKNGDKDERIVFDKTTKLTWQQSGSEKYLTYEDARRYITQLNHDKFAGYSDWRLPTLKEAITLLEEEENSDGLYIDTKYFDERQGWIWTSDLSSASRAWVVGFSFGSCHYDGFSNGSSVRAVR